MKDIPTSFCALVISFLVFFNPQLLKAQNSLDGFAPEIRVTATGVPSQYQLSAENYLNQAQTTMLVNNVASYAHDNGVFA